MARILLIDDDTDLTDDVCGMLEGHGHAVECLDNADRGLERLDEAAFDVVLVDNKMPRKSGLEFLVALRDRGIEIPVILMTGYSGTETAMRAGKLGAFYVIKPDDHTSLVRELQPMIQRAVDINQPRKVRPAPRSRPNPLAEPELVGTSKPMLEVCHRIGLFADGGDTVLILGDTGTGKELVARAIHRESSRKDKPFVAVNCAAIPTGLLESELFGHEKGAFTGAVERRIGRFELADGGTLFLDEIGDIPPDLQPKLLRVLQEQEFERLGSGKTIKVDVRVVAATHRDLARMVREGKFREDLIYRLDRLPIRLPPLRERLDDLPELVDYFLTREAQGQDHPPVAPEAMERLRAHHWRGNVRELENVISRAFRFCCGSQILPSDLELLAGDPDTHTPTAEADALAALHKVIAWAWDAYPEHLLKNLQRDLERELLRVALTKLDRNQTDVARRLGMARGIVGERIKEYKL